MQQKLQKKLKRTVRTILGFVCLFIGIIFMLLPGPAVIFLPLGLALLSVEYAWAKVWLKKTQRYFRLAAIKADQGLYWLGRKLRG